LELVLVEGVSLLTGGVAFCAALLAEVAAPAAAPVAAPAAAAPASLAELEASFAAFPAALLAVLAAFSVDEAVSEDAIPGLGLEVSHLSETMLMLCMEMVSLVAPDIFPLVAELAALLALAELTCPVTEIVWPTCAFNCEVSPVMLYCLPLAEIT
jgi:hypothetical protein